MTRPPLLGAKALQPTTLGDPDQSPTLTAAATQMGVVLGTAAYMSPEQAKGKVVDRRSDVWAFGAVLYEMLAGRRAFVGDDVSDMLVSVFRDDPDWSALHSEVPSRVRQAIQVCLKKDPMQRVRDIAAIRLALEGAFETTGMPSSEQPTILKVQVWQRPVPLLLAGVVLAAMAGLSVWTLFGSGTRLPLQPTNRFALLTLATSGEFALGNGNRLTVSPDGRSVAYTGQGEGGTQLYQRRLDQLDATPLRETEGANRPFFSPDGQWVGFSAATRARPTNRIPRTRPRRCLP